MRWTEPYHAACTLQPELLAVLSHVFHQSHGGLLVPQPLGIVHGSGTISGSTAAGPVKELSEIATLRQGDHIAEHVVKQQSIISRERRNFCVCCVATEITLLSGDAFS